MPWKQLETGSTTLFNTDCF